MAVSKAAIEFAKKHPKKRAKGSLLDPFVDDIKYLKQQGYTFQQMSSYMLQRHRITVTAANISHYYRNKIIVTGKADGSK